MDRVPDDELISAYLDDELSAEERAYVERLLVERPEARRLLEELRGVRESLQTLPSYRLEPDFGATVLRQAEREVLRGPPNGQVVEPRRDVIRTDGVRAEDAAGGSSSAAPLDGPRWRRPLAWSMLAVAAAVALMIVNRPADREQAVVLNVAGDGAKKLNEGLKDDAVVDALGRKRTEAEMSATTAPTMTTPAAEALRTKADVAAAAPNTTAPIDAPMPKAAAPAGQPTAGAFAVFNGGAVPPSATGQMRIDNKVELGGVGAAPPTVTGVNVPGVAADEGRPNLSKAGAGTLAISGANQYLDAAAVQSLSGLQQPFPSSQISGGQIAGAQVDTTPLVAANDYQRAQSLVAELNDVRRVSKTEDEAVRNFARRSLVADQRQQVQTFAERQANEQLLIVTIEVPNEEALNRCLVPVLQQQQIADLTTVRTRADVQLQFSNMAGNYGPPPATMTAAEATRENAEQPREEYFYVVANRKQIEGTLEALNRQADVVVDLEVEPAPADPSQQSWRGYSRDYGGRDVAAGEKAMVALGDKSAPLVANQTTANQTMPTLPAGAPPGDGDLVKKAQTETPQEAKNADGAAKQAEGLAANRLLERPSQPGLGASGGAGGGQPQLTTPQQQALVQQQDSYGLNLVPLSRSQRLRGVDASGLQLQITQQERGRFAVQDRIANEQRAAGDTAPGSAGGGKPTPSPATIAAPSPTVPAAPPTSAPSSSLPPLPAAAALGVVAGSTSSSSSTPVATQPAPSAVAGRATSEQSANAAKSASTEAGPEANGLLQTQLQLGYALPPDFHEALFICRVAPQVAAAKAGEAEAEAATPAKPAADLKANAGAKADTTPTKSAAPGEAKPPAQPANPAPPTVPRGKAE